MLLDPEPWVGAASPPYRDAAGAAMRAMTASEFDARAESWRLRAVSGELDAEIRASRAFRLHDANARALDLRSAASFVLATFPIATGVLHRALADASTPDDRDAVELALARVGECDRWGGAAVGWAGLVYTSDAADE